MYQVNYFTIKNFTIMSAQMNHSDYMRKVKTLSVESLNYIIKDCKEAIAALPDNPKNGYYMDEIHYCYMELVARRKKGKK